MQLASILVYPTKHCGNGSVQHMDPTFIQGNHLVLSVKEIFRFVAFQTSLVTAEVITVPVNCPIEANTSLACPVCLAEL